MSYHKEGFGPINPKTKNFMVYKNGETLSVPLNLAFDAVVKTTKSESLAKSFSLLEVECLTAYRGKVVCEKTQRSVSVEDGPEANFVTVRINCCEKATYEKDFSFEVEKFTQTKQFCSTCLYAVQLPQVFVGDEIIVYEATFYQGWKVIFIENLTTF